MATKSLVLLGLLAAVSLAAGECGSGLFQCRDGSDCVYGFSRCNGFSNCGDGSDEEGCDALPTVALPANASVTARVQFAAVHSIIELHLCGGQHCSNVWLWGEGNDGTLRYLTYTGCNRLGRDCRTVKEHWAGFTHFPPGEVVLEVQHRPGQLAVWRQGRPDDVVAVPVEADYATLRVRPLNWATDMPVQFTGFQRCGAFARDLKGKQLPGGSSWFFSKAGTVSRVKAAERVTEKLRCSDRAVECEVQRNNVKQFGAEYSNTTGTETSSGIGTSISASATIDAWFVSTTVEAAVSQEFTKAMAMSVSHGWSEETATSSTFVCHVPPGHVGWVEIKPEYIAKEGGILNRDCSLSPLVKWFPKTAADGSIAGERHCVVEKTSTPWRKR